MDQLIDICRAAVHRARARRSFGKTETAIGDSFAQRRGGLKRFAAPVMCGLALIGLASCGTSVHQQVQFASATQRAYPAVTAGKLGFDVVWSGQSGVWTDQWSYHSQHWTGPILLSRRSTPQTPTEIADSSSGAAVVGWEYTPPDRGGSISLTSLAPQFLLRYRSPSGSWQPTLRLPTSIQLRPHGVGIDSEGDAFAVWQTDAKHGTIMLSEHAANTKAWAQPEAVAPVSAGLLAGPDIAVSPAGALAVAWSANPTHDSPPRPLKRQTFAELNPDRVTVRSRVRQGRAWHTVRLGATGQRVSGGYSAEWPIDPVTVAINDAGTIAAGWQITPVTDAGMQPRLAIVTNLATNPRTHMLAVPTSSDVTYPTLLSGHAEINVNAAACLVALGPTGHVTTHATLPDWYSGPRPSVTREICSRLKRFAPAEGVAVAPNGLSMTVYQAGPDTDQINGIFSYTHPC